MGIGERIRQRRSELGMSQRDLADRMGYNNHSTVAKIENGAVDIPHSRIVQFAEVLSVSVEYLMGLDSASQTVIPNKSEQIEKRPVSEGEKQRADSRIAFSTNLRLFMAKAGKSRREVSEAIGVSYFTFSDWCNGKKYPRIEKLEALAEFFGVSVPELIDARGADGTHTPAKEAQQGFVSSETERIDTFANRLHLAMERTGIKRIELVKAAGIDQGAMTNYLKGKYEPKQDTVAKLAKILNVSERWLWGYGSEAEMVLDNHVPVSNQEQKAKEDVLDIILRLHTDAEFLKIVEKMSTLDSEKLKALQQFLKAFGE